ncbi:hypothetical protein [Sphingomonas paucimobilis]|uniref:hypothetical protein n=1 Tax=Sphingomonas paucimobilis TaxID=13689 RepID=UPI00064B9855|nr:hypothetical protein [Sphingomonas paucimobilis]
MSDDTNTKKAKVVRDFKDAGTLRSFTAGETVMLTPGEFGNYVVAGLVAEPDADEPATDPAA